MAHDSIVFNGIDATTGTYLIPPMSPAALSAAIRGEEPDVAGDAPEREQIQRELKWRHEQATEPTFAPAEGVDPKDLAQTGWGIIFAAGADAGVRDALAELLDHRKGQAGDLYREFAHADGYRPGDTKSGFLARHGATPGWVDPKAMPYYLLLAGDPEEIPYQFQYQLDVQHAVGRIWFETLEEYASYARSVVAAERTPARKPAAIFAGVQNPDDAATNLSATELVTPLGSYLATDQPDWQIRTMIAEETTKANLIQFLGGSQSPALLFTASHGLGFPNGHPLQLQHQGALLCQDWPGPSAHQGALPPDFYLSADDIGDDANLLGMLSFHFACYGVGTPKLDDFPTGAARERTEIAPRSFLARLPRRLLGHSRGGALASVGHIERAWGCSFKFGDQRQLSAFQSAFKRLMEGHPVGSAMEPFNVYYAEMATELTETLDTAKWTEIDKIDHLAISSLWTRHNDARAYAIIGDPAVRLNVAADAAPQDIQPVTIQDVERPVPNPEPAGPAPVAPGPGAPADTPQVAEQTFVIQVDVDERSVLGSTSTEAEISFGLGDKAADLVAALGDLVGSVSRSIQSAFSDAASLRVVTYTSDDLESVVFDTEKGRFSGSARLRAVTRQSLDGDMLLCLPEEDGEIDERIWAIHSEAVASAQTYRADLLKAVLSAASGLIPSTRIS